MQVHPHANPINANHVQASSAFLPQATAPTDKLLENFPDGTPSELRFSTKTPLIALYAMA
eukprot:5079993-Pleurochrysis_carterae.AAC.1